MFKVQVYINNIPSACLADFDDDDNTSCTFDWSDDHTPQVNTVLPSFASFGQSVVITG